MSYKKEILKNTGLNEQIDFDIEDVVQVKEKIDSIATKIQSLKEELNTAFREANEFRTDKGSFLIKGFNDYARAIQYLDKAFLEIRKGNFKGIARMPKGGPGTFYGDLEGRE